MRTAPGQVRTAAAADATRPIAPVNNGFRRSTWSRTWAWPTTTGCRRWCSWQPRTRSLSVSYTLSKATNTTEPNGNGPGPNDFNQLGEEERGPSILDQRHRAVMTASYAFPHTITVGTVTQLASARPFNPTTGVDNNGDGTPTIVR